MKFRMMGLLFSTIGMLLVFSVTAAAQTKKVNVKFKAGSSSGTFSNTVTGYGTVDFIVGAKTGQQMTVKLTSSNTFLYLNILNPDTGEVINDEARETTNWSGNLPSNGDYIIEVYLVRAEARRNKKPVNFSIDIEVQ